MQQLEDKYPYVRKAFIEGKFTVQKRKHDCSSIAIDHAQ
jgi:hypothetical protein